MTILGTQNRILLRDRQLCGWSSIIKNDDKNPYNTRATALALLLDFSHFSTFFATCSRLDGVRSPLPGTVSFLAPSFLWLLQQVIVLVWHCGLKIGSIAMTLFSNFLFAILPSNKEVERMRQIVHEIRRDEPPSLPPFFHCLDTWNREENQKIG